jgi:potassium-dependent mechanosensitive channel
MGKVRIALAALCAFWMVLASAGAFDAAIVGQAERLIASYRSDLARISQELRNPALGEQQLSDHRTELEKIRTGAIEQSVLIVAPISEVNQQIKSLGPAPAEGKTEPEGVATARSELQASLDKLQSVKSQLDVIAIEAEQQAGRVAAIQRDQFFQRIFDRNRSIVNPMLWYDMGVGMGVLASRLAALVRNWWAEVSPTANPLGLLLIPLFVGIFIGGYRFISRWFSSWTSFAVNGNRAPDDISRLWRIVRGQITTLVALAVLIVPIELALEASGYSTPRINIVWTALITTISATFLYYMLARRVAAPGLPAWRIINLDDVAASRFTVLAGLASIVAVSNAQLSTLADALYLGVNYSIGQSALAALIMLLLLALMLLTLRNQEGLPQRGGRGLYFRWASRLTPFMWLVVAVGLAALLLGYLSLANFIAQKVFRTGLLVSVLFLIHHLSDAAVAATIESQSGLGRVFRRITGLGERAVERAGLVFRTTVDVLLVLAGLPLLFLLWTLTWVDFGSLFNSIALGIRLGELTLSPGIILMVLFVLAGGIIFTNLVVRWLDRRILSETRIDKGVQDSIRKGASYAGFILAAGFALSVAGLDFSNLAIIAGALGVGIGFGLQSIVNNFVSGLILLAERPIRVGDWIALPVGEGLVKRINVRSTEIETFDSCSIIVPNSNLIVEPVKNWTHKDTISDAELVRKLLVETARNHDMVLTYPEPNVGLVKFGTTGLEFELRAFVADIFSGGAVASDIRFALLSQFREKGIIIPQPVAVLQPPQK